MAFFQNSVLNIHLKTQDALAIETAYQKFTLYFHDPHIQRNIRDAKEEQFQEGFLRELFVNILGYTLNPQPDYNLTSELKNERGSKKADGAILKDGKALGVIELKGTNTKDLDKINEQAFNYKNNQRACIYVITSNFEKLRFFIHNSVDYIEFNLFALTLDEFKVLWLCLQVDNLLSGIPLKLKEESSLAEENITKQLYKDYSSFKSELWKNMSKNHPLDDQLILFKKTQKLLDRFLFIFFAEDSGLLPPNSISKIIAKWKQDKDWGEDRQLYDIYKQYFGFINKGRPARGDRAEIFGYNGGLFLEDEVLDNLSIDDDVLLKHTEKLTAYDFLSEVDVSILGHIFENSLTEIENITARLEGLEINKSKTKRKKDGVFYTPKYITKYIVDHTIGKLCEEKKAELNISDNRFGRASKRSRKGIADLQTYRDWLLDLKICDPACGSGAFLNQALDFLIKEHGHLDELTAQYHKTPLVLSDIETQILEQNIYGVDINEESVEIAKLSLWLRTAQKGRKLTSLNNNIKCGNSLIDDPTVAGEKAFSWQKGFPEVFQKKEKKAWHVTTATHNSRYSQRMFDNYVKRGEAVWLSEKEEIIVTKSISEIVIKDKLNVIAYNICGDHMHLLLVCTEMELPKIVQKIKAISARTCNIAMGRTVSASTTTTETTEHAPLDKESIPSTSEHAPRSVGISSEQFREHAPGTEQPATGAKEGSTRGETQFHLWTQKFGKNEITSSEQLENTIRYIQNNRQKHGLSDINKELQPFVNKMLCDVRHAFRTEYNGGFDVVIGNPPYVVYLKSIVGDTVINYLNNQFQFSEYNPNTYALFTDLALNNLLRPSGSMGYIIPNSWLDGQYFSKMRKGVYSKRVNEIVYLKNSVFDEIVETVILFCDNITESSKKIKLVTDVINPERIDTKFDTKKFIGGYNPFITLDNPLLEKLETRFNKLGTAATVYRGLETRDNKKWLSEKKESEIHLPILLGRDVSKYHYEHSGTYVKFIKKEMKSNANETLYKKAKILMRRTGSKIIATIELEKLLALKNLYLIIPNETNELYSMIAQLNSKLMAYYHKAKSSDENKAFAQFKGVYVEGFPYVNCNEISFKNMVEEMVSKTTKLYGMEKSFVKLIQSKFNLEKLSKKLQNWHELDFKNFLKELEKAKVQLSLSEEAEWMQYFIEQKQKAQTLKSKINRVDTEIDKMVYALYGLTEEEIAIVEASKN